MTKEDVERTPIEAGRKLDDGISGHLIFGEDHDLSGAKAGVGRQRYRVRGLRWGDLFPTGFVRVPPSRQATTLLAEHGGPPEEERGKPHELDSGG